MALTKAQQCHALTTYFMSKYAEVFGSRLAVSRNKVRWQFEAMLMDYSNEQVKELIDFYFEKYSTPSIDWFLYNYEKLDEAKSEHDKKKIRTARMMEETRKRAEEWSKRWQQTN